MYLHMGWPSTRRPVNGEQQKEELNMERIPKPGEFYRHFKNKLYQIISVAEHTETGEQLVIYQALYGDFRTYARPLPMFASEVDREKYPEAGQKYRFERVTFRETADCGETMQGADAADCGGNVPSADKADCGGNVQSADKADCGGTMQNADNADGSFGEGSGEPKANPYLLCFLEAETYEEQMEQVSRMEGKVGQEELDSIYVVLDMRPETGSISDQLHGIQKFLKTRYKYDGARLRR